MKRRFVGYTRLQEQGCRIKNIQIDILISTHLTERNARRTREGCHLMPHLREFRRMIYYLTLAARSTEQCYK